MAENRRAADGVLEVHPHVSAGAKEPAPPGVADDTGDGREREETLLRQGGEATGALGGEDLTVDERRAAGLDRAEDDVPGDVGEAIATRGLAAGPED